MQNESEKQAAEGEKMVKLGEVKVRDVMATNVVSIDDTARLTDAIRLLDQNKLSALPVVDAQNSVVGILSTSDLLGIFYEVQSDLSALHLVNDNTRNFLVQMLADQGDGTTVRDVMTSPVDTIDPSVNLVVAARLLTKKRYHHLPVVDDKGVPIGMLSTTDFMRAFAEHGALMAG